MSMFTGHIGREEEDGLGWGGLLPDKESRITDGNVTNVMPMAIDRPLAYVRLEQSTEEPNEIDATVDTSFDWDELWEDAPSDDQPHDPDEYGD